jgi:methylthioribulose-1-phosphate dehydratase
VIGNSQDMDVLGDRLALAHDPRVPAVVVAGHGLYVWGADPMRARHHTEIVPSRTFAAAITSGGG